MCLHHKTASFWLAAPLRFAHSGVTGGLAESSPMHSRPFQHLWLTHWAPLLELRKGLSWHGSVGMRLGLGTNWRRFKHNMNLGLLSKWHTQLPLHALVEKNSAVCHAICSSRFILAWMDLHQSYVESTCVLAGCWKAKLSTPYRSGVRKDLATLADCRLICLWFDCQTAAGGEITILVRD